MDAAPLNALLQPENSARTEPLFPTARCHPRHHFLPELAPPPPDPASSCTGVLRSRSGPRFSAIATSHTHVWDIWWSGSDASLCTPPLSLSSSASRVLREGKDLRLHHHARHVVHWHSNMDEKSHGEAGWTRVPAPRQLTVFRSFGSRVTTRSLIIFFPSYWILVPSLFGTHRVPLSWVHRGSFIVFFPSMLGNEKVDISCSLFLFMRRSRSGSWNLHGYFSCLFMKLRRNIFMILCSCMICIS